MREIKFRGKRKDNGEWIYGSLVYDERGFPFIVGAVVESCEEYIALEVWCPVEKNSVGQLTGLHDKNGKEIFQGDIIKREFKLFDNETDKIISSVEWGTYNDGKYVNNIECWISDDWPISDLGGLYAMAEHTIEVIGNIYEHPELLNKDKT